MNIHLGQRVGGIVVANIVIKSPLVYTYVACWVSLLEMRVLTINRTTSPFCDHTVAGDIMRVHSSTCQMCHGELISIAVEYFAPAGVVNEHLH